MELNEKEPFDEWEEFVLFASHYFLLVAANPSHPVHESSPRELLHQSQGHQTSIFLEQNTKSPLIAPCEPPKKPYVPRRFGAITQISPDILGHHGGLGPQSRLATTELHSLPGNEPQGSQELAEHEKDRIPPPGIEPRMCHTITALDQGGCLLVGGRTSPDRALVDCWLLRKSHWQRVENLPMPLFRHCATQVLFEKGAHSPRSVLIYGGKTRICVVSNIWLLWRESKGWVELPVSSSPCRERFGAVMASTAFKTGVLLGGMAADGTILEDQWEWTLSERKAEVSIDLRRINLKGDGSQSAIGRMGACLVNSLDGLLLIGGVSSKVMPRNHDISRLTRDDTNSNQTSYLEYTLDASERNGQRPLLVGHSTFVSQEIVIILGGGAVCFSFGTCWNAGMITLSRSKRRGMSRNEGIKPPSPTPSIDKSFAHLKLKSTPLQNARNDVMQRLRLETSCDFERVLNRGQPVVIGQTDLGSCTDEWTLEKLKAKIGYDRDVRFKA